jgi:beta-lactam-binding protein with PASTA domain
MKHLSATPRTLLDSRPDIPKALDMVVLRALAKDPAARYQSAEEMDADLERVGRGLSVSRETEDAATTVVPAGEATQVRRPPPPPSESFDYAEPARGRSLWPWLLAILLVAGAVIAGFYVYRQIQYQLNQAKPVGVPDVVGIKEILADQNLRDVGLETNPAHIHRLPNSDEPRGYVYDQDPNAGDRVGKGSFVELWVSSGKPQVTVPNLVGQTRDDAVAKLTDLKLTYDVHDIPSPKTQGTVIAQDPGPGEKVDEKTKVRINVSSGPQPIGVPDVRGESYDSAASRLQGLDFAVARKFADSDQPAGTVIDENPAAGTFAPKRSTITLTVSKGPQTTSVPGVVGFDEQTARSTLEGTGFKVKVVKQDTDDPLQEGNVISQDPPAGEPAKPGTKVTIAVGHLKATPPGDTTTETTTTAPAP